MTPPAPGAIVYTRHVIQIAEEPRFDAALTQISALKDAIAVNVVQPGAAEPMAMSEAHLRRAIDAADDRLEVQTIPLQTFLEVMRLKLSELDRQVHALRAALRTDYVEDAIGEIQPLLRHLDQIVFLVDAFALQRREAPAAEPAAALAAGRTAIVKAVEARDNVACLDALYYEMAPAIRQLALMFTL